MDKDLIKRANGKVTELECVKCGRFFEPEETETTCPVCGIEGILDVHYDYEFIKKNWKKDDISRENEFSMWRYFPILPVAFRKSIPPLRVGVTPLYDVTMKFKEFRLKKLYIKDEGLNPTGSLKDRASAVGVARAYEQGAKLITCASTGNAASSLAGITASVGIKSIIFVPKNAPKAKIAQLLIFGSKVFTVKGTYDEAFELSSKVVEELKAYNRNCAVNPYLVEGKKTATLEVLEQLGFQAPDFIITSVGDGCILSSVWKACKDFYKLEFINKLPRLVAVQSEGCKPVVDAFYSGEFKPVKPQTIADSIAVGVPRNRLKALRALKESDGIAVAVSDDDILRTMKILGNKTGVFGEPAGVTGFAGLLKLASTNDIFKNATVVVLVTGNGLKDINAAMKIAGNTIDVEPDFEKFKEQASEFLFSINSGNN